MNLCELLGAHTMHISAMVQGTCVDNKLNVGTPVLPTESVGIRIHSAKNVMRKKAKSEPNLKHLSVRPSCKER